jgi:hypothetical protein
MAPKSYKLRLGVMGTPIEIKSPVPCSEFLQGMCDLINHRGADPEWTGYYEFEKLDGKTVWVRVRAIDVVEEIKATRGPLKG